MMDFSGHAGSGSDFDILPKGLIVWANLQVRGVKASGAGGRYLDLELTVDQGQPFAGRKIWDMLGDPFFDGNSEKYRQMGMVAITRILEAGRGASPNNPAGYQLSDFSQLSGLRVPIKVGVENGTDGHDDKNRVAEWLTPNPASNSGHKGYVKLMAGDHGIAAAAPAANAQQNSGFGFGGSAASTPQPATTGFGNGSGFQQPPADSSGQSGANGATTAWNQSQNGDASAAPSNAGSAPGWLAQANGAPQ